MLVVDCCLFLQEHLVLWPKIRHPAELGVITRVSSMRCAEGLP